MATKTTANVPTPAAGTPSGFALPSFPGYNLDAVVALQKANVEALAQVQKILTDAAETAWQTQVKRYDAWQSELETAFKTFDVTKKPEAYAKDAQAAVEGVIAETQAAVASGVKTQREVAQILADRAVANLNELKTLAA